MLTSNFSSNMQKHGYLGCFHSASTRENISWVWVIQHAEAQWQNRWEAPDIYYLVLPMTESNEKLGNRFMNETGSKSHFTKNLEWAFHDEYMTLTLKIQAEIAAGLAICNSEHVEKGISNCRTPQKNVLVQGLYSLRRHCLIGISIPIMNLRQSSDRLRFIMGILIPVRQHHDGLVQDCSNSSALAMELLESCTKPLICLVYLGPGIITTMLHAPKF